MKSLRLHKRIVRSYKTAKGISQVIAVLLMIAIAVIAALVAYFWVTGYFRSQSSQISKAIQIQSAYYTGNEAQYLGVYVQSVGQGAVTLIPNQCLYVNGVLEGSARINPNALQEISYTLQKGDTALVGDVISLSLGQTIKIKVVTSEGTFVEKYFTINGFQGQSPYSITINVNPPAGGSVSADVLPPYHYGDVVTLTETPNPGYTFSGWNGEGSGVGTTRAVNVTGNMVVTAGFTQNTYALTVTINPSSAAGSVTPDNPGPYYYGDVVTLTETPATGYTFSNWGGDGSGSATTCAITIDGDMTVTADFTQSPYSITINVNPPAGGSVSADVLPPYHLGDVVTLTETPNPGYTFSGWSGDGSGTGTTRTVTVIGNMTVTADFTQNTYTLAFTVNPSSAGSVTADNPGPYHYGDVVTLTETPNTGYTFSTWGGDGSGSATTCAITIDGDKAVAANFTQNAVLDHFTIGSISSPQTAGSAFSVTITAVDQFGNTLVSYTGPATLSDLSLSISPTTTGAFTSGVWTGSVNIAQTYSGDEINVTDSGKIGISNAFDVNPAGASKLVYTAGTGQSLTVGYQHVSSVITVQRQDSNGNPVTSGGTITVTLATNSTGGRFYSDPSGNNRIYSVTISSGSSSANFYYADSTAGSPVLTASSGILASATTQFTINNYYLSFRTGSGQTLATGQVSSGISVRRYDSNDNSYYGPAITVALTTNSSGGHFSANSDGSGTITSVTISSGSRDSSTFYYVDSAVGTPVLTASSAGYTSGQTTFTISSYYLGFRTGSSQTLLTGQVSSGISVRRYSPDGSSYSSGPTITVALTTNSSGGHFSANSDGSGTITSIAISSGSSTSNTFYYVDSAAGTPVLTASSAGYTSATTTFTIRMPVLVFSAGAPQSLTAGSISARITVQRQDGSGNAYSPSTAIAVGLASSSGSGVFYSDAAGTQVITQITIGSGADHAYIYYKDTVVGFPTLTASSTGYVSATTTFTVYAAGTKLVFIAGASQTLTRNAVSSVITVQLQDSGGNPILATSAVTVSLSSNSSGGEFYSDANGYNSITSVTIASGTSSANFYYADSSAGTPTLTASSGSLTPATTTFTINSYKLVFTAGAGQSLTAGTVSSVITVQRQTSSGSAYTTGSITVNLVSTSGGGAFYSNSGGTNQITSVNIASGSSSANFYYKDTTVGSPTLTASANGYTPATTTFMILASGAKLVFTAGASQTLTASTVSSVITVQLQDSGGNPILATGTGVVVSLSTNSSNGRFYSDSAGNNRITSVTIASGASSANFYYYDSAAGHPILTVSSGSLTPATTQFTINSYYLSFRTGTGQTLTTGQVSSGITIRRYYYDGSSYSSGPTITVALTTNSSGGHFSSNSDGSGTITSITITSGNRDSSTFYYVDSAVGTPVLTASSAGYTSGQTTFTITGPASKLVFTAGTSQSLYTNTVSSVITVQRQDAAGYGVTSGSITVSLGKTSATGSFCSNPDGTGAITQVTIASGASSANFYYKDTAAGSSTITASSGSLTPATTTFTITLNQVPNGGFESPGVWTTGGTGYATSQDTDETNIPPHSGIFAELDSAYQTATEYGSLINTFSPAIALSSIPNTAGSLSTWVYNNGHNGVAVGYYSFQIALTASDGTQLIYWWGSTPANAPTETATTKIINMGTLPGMFTVGQWVQFSRNLPADWASKGLSSSTSITSIIIRNDGYQSGGNQYGQEIFIDDVQIQ